MVGGITSLVSQPVALPRIILLSHRSYLPVTWRRLFSDSLVTCRDSGYRHPIIKPADEVSCTRRRSPVGSSFPCQLVPGKSNEKQDNEQTDGQDNRFPVECLLGGSIGRFPIDSGQ